MFTNLVNNKPNKNLNFRNNIRYKKRQTRYKNNDNIRRIYGKKILCYMFEKIMIEKIMI